MSAASEELDVRWQSRPSRVGRNVSMLTVAQFFTWGMTLIWTLFVPRRLGPSGMGFVVLAWSASSLLTVLGGASSRTLLTKRVAAAPAEAARLLSVALTIRAVCVVPAVVITTLYIAVGHFGGTGSVILYLAVGISLLTMFLEPVQGTFQGFEAMQYIAYADMLNKALVSVGGVVLVLFGADAVAVVWMTLVAALVALATSLFWVRRYIEPVLRVSWRETAAFFKESLSYWAFTLFYAAYLWIDSVMLSVMAPTRVLGWYGVPTKLFGSLLFVAVIIGTAWLPRLTAAYQHGGRSLRAAARQPLELVLIVGLPIGVGAALVSGALIELLYGPDFAPAEPVFALLALTTVPMYVNIVVYQVLVASDRQGQWTRALAGATVVNPILNYFLIRFFQARFGNGAVGAALSLLLTELLIVVLGLVLVRHFLDRRTLARVLRTVLATFGMAAGVLVLARLGVGIFVQVPVGGALFGGLALLLGVPTTEERERAARLFARARARARALRPG